MDGFLNIDKPKGITSYDVIRILKKRLGVQRIGHAGNLDPHATGVLVVGIGKATRFLPFVQELEKEYIAVIQLGVLTDTLDITGEVLDTREVRPFSQERLLEVLKRFEGEIKQTPPAYSAVRVAGQRLYKLAREGIHVVPKPKTVFIHRLELLAMERDSFTLRILCSKGTYIRSLARDIGEALGTYGIVKELQRTRVGHFRVEDAVSPDDPEIEKRILPIDQGLAHMPEVFLSHRAADLFRHGNRVPSKGIQKFNPHVRAFQKVRVYDEAGRFLGVGLFHWDRVDPKRVLSPS